MPLNRIEWQRSLQHSACCQSFPQKERTHRFFSISWQRLTSTHIISITILSAYGVDNIFTPCNGFSLNTVMCIHLMDSWAMMLQPKASSRLCVCVCARVFSVHLSVVYAKDIRFDVGNMWKWFHNFGALNTHTAGPLTPPTLEHHPWHTHTHTCIETIWIYQIMALNWNRTTLSATRTKQANEMITHRVPGDIV